MPETKSAKISHLILAFLAVFLAATGMFAGRKGQASSDVDLVLVLALDVSASIDVNEYELMREGLANALASDEVHQAVRAGQNGAIIISVMQWSGFTEQEVKIEWTRVADRGDLLDLADEIRRMTRRYKDGATDIGGAIKFSRELINSTPFPNTRKVIDIAGDGTNNVNTSPSFERDITVQSGVTINGFVIIGEALPLVDFYTRFVIGGDAAFVESVRDYDGFETGMKRKLVREIGGGLLF